LLSLRLTTQDRTAEVATPSTTSTSAIRPHPRREVLGLDEAGHVGMSLDISACARFSELGVMRGLHFECFDGWQRFEDR